MEFLKFGLIGRNISYSFSKSYFEIKFKSLNLKNHSYDLFDIPNLDNVEDLLNQANIRGLNVTIPYKEKIIPFLDDLSDEAKKIGAVNCISIKNNRKTGYNTDVFGFEQTLLRHKKPNQNKALVLGNGGAAKAVKYVLKKHNILYKTVARNSELSFENLIPDIVKQHQIIIQCTPVGTFPNIDSCIPFPFDALSQDHLAIDLIYNPRETKFLAEAKKRNTDIANGLFMLEQQAEKAWQIWSLE